MTLDHTSGTFRLERNKGYHRPNGSTAVSDAFVIPAVLKAVWNVDPDVTDEEYMTALIDQLAEKTVFYIGDVPPEKRAEMKNSAVITDVLSTYSYLFNCANPLFDDPAVRSILASVIDRNTILSFTVYGKAATGLIPGTVNDGSKASSSWKTGAGALSPTATKSVSVAKEQLDAIEGYVPGEFKLTYLDTEINGKIAAYVKGLWDELGYTVTLDPVIADTRQVEDGGTITVYDSMLQTRYASRNYDVLAIDYQMYSTNALAVFATLTDTMNGSGVNYGASEGVVEGATLDELINNTEEVVYTERMNRLNYASETYDAKVEAAYAEKDLSKRSVLLHEAEEILLSEMPLIPLVFNQRAYLASDDLSGLKVDRFGFVSFTSGKQKNYELYLAVDDDVVATTSVTTAEPEETEGEEEAGE